MPHGAVRQAGQPGGGDQHHPYIAALNGQVKHSGPQWRATINRGLIRQRFAVIGDSVAEQWVRGKLRL
jgi:hypothetical protein